LSLSLNSVANVANRATKSLILLIGGPDRITEITARQGLARTNNLKRPDALLARDPEWSNENRLAFGDDGINRENSV
jgi:hypothetical protein